MSLHKSTWILFGTIVECVGGTLTIEDAHDTLKKKMTFICDARERAGAFVLNDPCGSEYIELGNDENCLTRRRLMPDGGFLLPPAEPDMEKGIRAERSRRASAAPHNAV